MTRFVFDINALTGAFLIEESVPSRALRSPLNQGVVLVSVALPFLCTVSPDRGRHGRVGSDAMPSRPRRRRRSTPTPADIWRIFHEAARERKAADRRLAAMEAGFRREEAERQRAEEQRRRAEEQRRQEAAEREARLDERINKVTGDFDNRWGRLMEALVEGDLLGLLQEQDINVDELARRVSSRVDGTWREYDLVALGVRDAVVVEVKTTLRVADVERFTERIADFCRWRPADARPRVRGALGFLTTDEQASGAAEAAGFYLVRAVGGSAAIVNSAGFEPRLF